MNDTVLIGHWLCEFHSLTLDWLRLCTSTGYRSFSEKPLRFSSLKEVAQTLQYAVAKTLLNSTCKMFQISTNICCKHKPLTWWCAHCAHDTQLCWRRLNWWLMFLACCQLTVMGFILHFWETLTGTCCENLNNLTVGSNNSWYSLIVFCQWYLAWSRLTTEGWAHNASSMGAMPWRDICWHVNNMHTIKITKSSRNAVKHLGLLFACLCHSHSFLFCLHCQCQNDLQVVLPLNCIFYVTISSPVKTCWQYCK